MNGRAQKFARGFSLFELAVVIALVALLISIALPRFEKTLRAAHATAVSMNGRALIDGTRAAKAMRDVQGLSGAVYDLPRFANGRVDLSTGGFPAGATRKRGDRLSAAHCAEIWRAVLQPNPEQQGAAARESFDAQLARSGSATVCRYVYRRDAAMAITYDPVTGEVKVYAGNP